MKILPLDIMQRLEKRLVRLYGEILAPRLKARLTLLAGRYSVEEPYLTDALPPWDQHDAVLITYGNMLSTPAEKPLSTLARFLSERTNGVFSIIHLLPFFLSNPDHERAVIDYRQVNPALGNWEDIEMIAREHKLMVNLLLNQVSKESNWFADYINGIEPAREYFISIDPTTDLSAVVRPCCRPVLVPTPTRRGERHLWSTYADEQVDTNFANADVLFEFLDIMLFYVTHGARIICLNDAAYLWKCPGTCCVNLPETHELIRFFRDLLKMMAPDALLLAEAKLPHQENISYFGDGDEAQLIVQYSLPPLLLQALQTGSARYLTQWASSLPALPSGCTFLNLTGSEAGITLRPLEGLMPNSQFGQLIDALERRGADIVMYRDQDGRQQPYEADITFFDALSDLDRPVTENHIARFLCAQSILLALKGIPALYFNDLMAAHKKDKEAEYAGWTKSLNQKRWNEQTLIRLLDNPDSLTATVFNETLRRLKLRRDVPAFHPDGAQHILALDDRLFGVQRIAPDESAAVICISNLTGKPVPVLTAEFAGARFTGSQPFDLIGQRPFSAKGRNARLQLEPYQSVWLAEPPKNPE
jgi:glycosidase